MLRPGEQALRDESVSLLLKDNSTQKGRLILTNRRIIYESALGSVATPLSAIKSVFDTKIVTKQLFLPTRRKCLTIEFSDGCITLVVSDAKGWKENISSAKRGYELGRKDLQTTREIMAEEKKEIRQLAKSAQIPVISQREIIKEIVRIPCKYCGRLVDVTAKSCDGCGASASR